MVAGVSSSCTSASTCGASIACGRGMGISAGARAGSAVTRPGFICEFKNMTIFFIFL